MTVVVVLGSEVQGFVEALDDAVGLRALGLGLAMVDVLDRQVELILVALGVAAVLGTPTDQSEIHCLPRV